MKTGLVAVLLLSTSLTLAAEGPRHELSLNGPWQFQRVSELSEPPNSGEWKGCVVPGYLHGTDYQRAWLRRPFSVPAEMRGQRIKLHFGGVKFNSRVYVNGKHVGGCFGGYEPFEVDVTDAVRFDGPNELAVGCHDWTGVFTPGRVRFPDNANWDTVRGVPRDKILSPIGGLFGMYGIWDDVTLRSHPPVYVKDWFIKPSVRRGELVVEYTVANESDRETEVELSAIVEDHGKDVLALPSAKIRVAAAGAVSATLKQRWPNPPLWSHVDPHLLHLRTSLSTGDRSRTRFGFREFWVEGHKFFLNGSRVNLLATSWWPPHGWMTRDEILKHWKAVKRMGCVAFRTHTQPWPSLHYEVADEVGLLMIPEGAVWNDDDTYRIDDPVFWQNYAKHLKAMVDRDKNRPSVVIWSLENEFFGGRLNDASPAKKDLVRMGRLMKEWDPTRPIFYESDGDPDGVADVIGIHYPHEYPDFTCWPDEAWWLEKPATIPHMFLNGQKEFVWKKDKPIYVGEFLWIPSRDPSWHTVFFGDEAYTDYHRYRNLAKAEAWKMQILGYRQLEVGGISPWTVIEGGPLDETNPLFKAHLEAYRPIAAYPLQYDRRFFFGERVPRRLAVFNDALGPSTLDVKWTLRLPNSDRPLDRGEQRISLGPGEQRTIEVQLQVPRAEQIDAAQIKVTRAWTSWSQAALVWHLEVQRDGRTEFEARHDCYAMSRPAVPSGKDLSGVKIHLYDPAGTTRKAIESLGFPVVMAPGLEKIGSEVDVLIVGTNTLRADSLGTPIIGRTRPERAAIRDFVTRGGRLAVLHQDAYPEGMFDVQLSDQRSTMTFPLTPGFFREIDLGRCDSWKFWRPGHLVATRELSRPASGGFRPILVSGSSAGIDHCPLLLQRMGRGCILYSQLLAVEKCADEPAAALALAGIVEVLLGHESASRKTAILGGDETYRQYLRSLGLRFDEVDKTAGGPDARQYGLWICRGELNPMPSGLRAFVEAGGNLYVHRPDQRTLHEICREFALDLAARPYAGPVSRGEAAGGIADCLPREDLYWLGKHVGIDWADTPRATNMTDGVFVKTLDEKKASAHEIEDWRLEGGLVERVPPGVTFATVGKATATLHFPETGVYILGLVARGTPCNGQYPLAEIKIDGKPFGTIAIDRRDWHTATTFGHVSQGDHEVSVAFVNDASNPPLEDRNLYVDKLLVALDHNRQDVKFLTFPPAVAELKKGQGRILIDLVRWDAEEQNARKAARLASALLTEMGGDFLPRLGTTIECERMTPQPGMPHFSNQGSHASLACNGYIQTPIEIATTQRYTMELVAAGSSAAGVYPLVGVAIDGKTIAQVQLTSGNWRSYFVELDLPGGRHELRLAFLNDLNANGEDRNLRLDKVSFYPE